MIDFGQLWVFYDYGGNLRSDTYGEQSDRTHGEVGEAVARLSDCVGGCEEEGGES